MKYKNKIVYHRRIRHGVNKGAWVVTDEFRNANQHNFRMTRAMACGREADYLRASGENVLTWTEEVAASEKV